MKRGFIIMVFVCVISIAAHGQVAIVTDSIIKTTNNKRYNGNRDLDTLSINGRKIVISKRALRYSFNSYTNERDEIVINGDTIPQREAYQLIKKSFRDSIRAHKNVWATVIAAPSYSPESSFGIGGGALITFKVNPNNKTQFRSNLPIGFVMSVNGTFSLSGLGSIYFKNNQLQMKAEYGIRYEPTDYFGVGYGEIESVEKGEETTEYRQFKVGFRPTILFNISKNLYAGALIDYCYYKLSDINPVMAQNSYYDMFSDSYLTAGVGVDVRYDTRDNPTMPYSGLLASYSTVFYGRALGSKYNFTYTSLNYRQFKQLFERRSVLAWCAQLDMATGDIPITNLPTFGSANDMRGYDKGKYRDKTMAFAIIEYRHMFGSNETYKTLRPVYSRLGFALWGGVASIAENIGKIDKFKFSIGIGARYEVQPNINFRLDFGKAISGGDMLVYFNITEAF